MPTLLISGFEPFQGFPQNPSQDIAHALHGTALDNGVVIQSCVLPVVRFDSAKYLLKAIEKHRPIAVLALGQAARHGISLERIAINIDDYRYPDNAGNQPIDQPIIEGAPSAHWSTLPIKQLQEALQRTNVPVHISNSAGTFVCNHLFFQLQHALCDRNVPSGFVHVPLLPEQTAIPKSFSMPLKQQITAIQTIAQQLAL